MTKLNKIITTGEVTIKGKSPEGKDVEITAEVGELIIDVETAPVLWNQNPYNISTNFGNLSQDQSVTFNIKLKRGNDGAFYSVKTKTPKSVERTARVEVPALTPDEIAGAADKAGVPLSTPFNIVSERENGKTITFLEFYWTE